MEGNIGPMRAVQTDRFAPCRRGRKRCYQQLATLSYRPVKGYVATKIRKLNLSSHDEAPGMCVKFYLRIMENIYTIFVGNDIYFVCFLE